MAGCARPSSFSHLRRSGRSTAVGWVTRFYSQASRRRCPPLSTAFISGVLPRRALVSLETLLVSYAIGVLLATILTSVAISSRIGTDLLETLTSMFNPLPAIALLPLALIWFGLGVGSVIFVVVHSVLWAVALNTHGGFQIGLGDHAHGRPELRTDAASDWSTWSSSRVPSRASSPASRSVGHSPGER